mmetsp:Transcript_40804/g.88394  ORF Transcript_40804/g.88394 Transcript_40804/m.88394 type:complete len:261 (+) Transcript_40804:1538-2320(+)
MICKENRHKNDENDGQNCTGHYNACKKITHGSEQVLHASLQIQVNLGHVRGKTVDDATTRCCVQPTHRCLQYCPQCLLVHRNGQSQGAPLEHQNASQGEEQNAKGDHSIDGQSIPRAHLRLNFRPMSQPQSRCQVSNRGDQVQNNDPKGATAHCTHESTPDSQTQVTLFHIFGTLLGFLHYHWSCIFASVLGVLFCLFCLFRITLRLNGRLNGLNDLNGLNLFTWVADGSPQLNGASFGILCCDCSRHAGLIDLRKLGTI